MPFVWRRGRVYQYRQRLPKKLTELGSPALLCLSLRTEVLREAMKRAPKAEALLLAGGAWRSLAAVPILEEDYGIPVITNPIAQVWRLMAEGIAPPVKGWGRLLAQP